MLGILFAILSGTMLAANYIFIQLGMKHAANEKDNGVFLGIIVNVVLVGFIYLVMLPFKTETVEWNLSGILAFAVAGILTTLLGRVALYAGIRRIGSSRAAAMKNGAPIFSLLAAIILLNERISLLSGIGILLVMLGLFFLARKQWQQNGKSVRKQAGLGFLLGGLSAFLYGVGQVYRKVGLVYMNDPVLGALMGAIFALLAYVLALAWKGELKSTFNQQVRKINKYYFLGGLSIGFGLLSFFTSASLINVSYTSAIAAAEPVITVILAYFFLKQQEQLDRHVILSILLVFTGIVVIAISTL